jgi:hypothetical protein
MRWTTSLALALSLAACRQTVVFDQQGGGADGGLPFCSGPPVDFDPESPEVIVALDRSAGMSARFGDGTVLTAARDALDEHAARYQKVIRFGYVEFPGSGSVCSPQAGCCAGMVSFPSQHYAAFDLALHACDLNPARCAGVGYQRPTTPALTSCALVFAQRQDAFRRYVLLVSNGRPDCGMNQGSGCMDAQAAVNQLATNGVATVVVAPGLLEPDAEECLQGIAVYGGARYSPYLFPASNPVELDDQIGDLTRAIATDACELDLHERVMDPDRVVFRWKDTQIPRHRSNMDGWELTMNGFEIVLHGEWCDRLIDGGPADFALFTNCEPQH